MSIKPVDCPACGGVGHLPIAVRYWIDRKGVRHQKYPVCNYCGGKRYVSRGAAPRSRHRIR